jgi:hypothetical protein
MDPNQGEGIMVKNLRPGDPAHPGEVYKYFRSLGLKHDEAADSVMDYFKNVSGWSKEKVKDYFSKVPMS